MKKLGSFDEFINEKDDSLNESFLLAAGIAILIALGIKGLRKITKQFALKQDLKPNEFKKMVDDIVNDAKVDSSNADKPNIDKWGVEMQKLYDKGEIKNLEDLVQYIDSTHNIFVK